MRIFKLVKVFMAGNIVNNFSGFIYFLNFLNISTISCNTEQTARPKNGPQTYIHGIEHSSLSNNKIMIQKRHETLTLTFVI